MKRNRNGSFARRNRSRRSRRLRTERLEARLLLAVDFQDSGQLLGEFNTFDVALGDLDGDEDVDAFVIDRYTNRVWLNNDGQFTAGWDNPADYSGCRYPSSVALGDLDADGDLDAFISADGGKGGCPPQTGANTVWFNDGSGNFQDSGQSLGDSSSRGVALGDLDGNGSLDVFVTARGHWSKNEVWLNDGDGFFANTGQRLGGYESIDVDLADLDGDGDLDAFVANSSQRTKTGPGEFSYVPNPDKIWLNDGSGFFTDSGQELLVGSDDSRSQAVSLGDLDGDGDYDAFVVDNAAGVPNQVWINTGLNSGVFAKGDSLGDARGIDVSLGDVDGDGDLDAAVANSLDYGSEVWLNNGTGTFEDSGQSLAPDRRSLCVALGDLNEDGQLDIFLGNGTRSTEATGWPDLVYWNVTADGDNQPPSITSTAVVTATQDLPYVYDVDASDPDAGDTLTYSLDVSPGGMAINSDTGLIDWTPDNGQIGLNDVTVRVEDQRGGSDTQSFEIDVANVNDPPIIVSTPVTEGFVDVPYSYDVNADDADIPIPGDQLTYILDNSPTGMDIDPSTGVIEWTPTIIHDGASHTVTVRVTDGEAFDTQTFEVTVSSASVEMLYVDDIWFESKPGGRWRAVFEIRSDSNGNAAADDGDDPIAGVSIEVTWNGTTFTGSTDSDGIFRTDWVRKPSTNDNYANVVDLALAGYVWNPLDLDLEDDSDGDGNPDALF